MTKRLFVTMFVLLAMSLSVMSVAGTNLVNQTTTVAQNNYFHKSFSITDNETLTITIDIYNGGGPVDLLLMNSSSFTYFKNYFSVGGPTNISYIASASQLSTANKTYTADLTKGDYVVIIENADFVPYGATTYGAEAIGLSITAVPTTTSTSSTSTPGFEVPIFLFSVVTIFGIVKLRKYKR